MFPETAEQKCWVGTGPRVGTDKLTVVREQGLGDLRERNKRKERRKRERRRKRGKRETIMEGNDRG